MKTKKNNLPIKLLIGLLTLAVAGCNEDLGNNNSELRNHTPVAVITATPESGTTPLEVHFSAEESFDPDGDAITSYLWEFGDGGSGSGINVTHVYNQPGTFVARLAVSDRMGGIGDGMSSIVIHVDGEPGPHCKPSFLQPSPVSDEYIASLRVENTTEDLVWVDGGTAHLSKPVSVQSTDEGTDIATTEATTEISFSVGQALEPGQTHIVRFHGSLSDSEDTSFTSCTLH